MNVRNENWVKALFTDEQKDDEMNKNKGFVYVIVGEWFLFLQMIEANEYGKLYKAEPL